MPHTKSDIQRLLCSNVFDLPLGAWGSSSSQQALPHSYRTRVLSTVSWGTRTHAHLQSLPLPKQICGIINLTFRLITESVSEWFKHWISGVLTPRLLGLLGCIMILEELWCDIAGISDFVLLIQQHNAADKCWCKMLCDLYFEDQGNLNDKDVAITVILF